MAGLLGADVDRTISLTFVIGAALAAVAGTLYLMYYGVVHFGDLGRMLNTDEMQRLHHADCIMIPCGGFFTIDAVQAKTIIEKLEPRVVILMHYRTPVSGYSLLEDLDSIRKTLPETEVLDSTSLELNGQESGTRIVALKAIQ